jgi:hypothetical protein
VPTVGAVDRRSEGRTSALGLRHLGLGVGDGALERLDVIAFGLTDDPGDARVTAGSTCPAAECG